MKFIRKSKLNCFAVLLTITTLIGLIVYFIIPRPTIKELHKDLTVTINSDVDIEKIVLGDLFKDHFLFDLSSMKAGTSVTHTLDFEDIHNLNDRGPFVNICVKTEVEQECLYFTIGFISSFYTVGNGDDNEASNNYEIYITEKDDKLYITCDNGGLLDIHIFANWYDEF